MSTPPDNPQAQERAENAETQQRTHLSGPFTFAGKPLYPLSFGRRAILEGITRNLELEQQSKLGQWTETKHPDKEGADVYFSRVSRETRIMFTLYAMTLTPAQLQAIQDDHKGFASAAILWADALPADALTEAEKIYNENQKRISAAVFEVVPPKDTGPKDEAPAAPLCLAG